MKMNKKKIYAKGQWISKQNCRAITSPKKRMDEYVFYPDDSEIIETWNWNSSFKYVRIEKQIRPFLLGEVTARQCYFEIYWPLRKCQIKWEIFNWIWIFDKCLCLFDTFRQLSNFHVLKALKMLLAKIHGWFDDYQESLFF